MMADETRPEKRPALQLPLQTQLKVLLMMALRNEGITRAELARRLDWHREQVDRLFRLDHASRLDQIDAAFKVMGQHIALDMQPRTEL